MSEKKISWTESWKLNARACRLLLKRYPKAMMLSSSAVFVKAITPYVEIYLSARIIGELAGACRLDVLRQMVLILLAVTFLLGIVRSILCRYHESEKETYFMKLEGILNEKLMQMDFMEFDQTETKEKITKIKDNAQNANWGIYHAANNIERLLEAFCTVMGAAVLTISLFTAPVSEQAGSLAVLNHPLLILGLLAALLLIIYMGPSLAAKADQFWAEHVNDHILMNSLFSFYVNLPYEREKAMDIRIYQQDRMCKKYMQDNTETGAFGINGIFAQYARKKGGLYRAVSGVVSVLCTGLLYMYICLKAWAGAFGIGMVTQYIASATTMAKGLSGMIGELQDMRNNAPFLKLLFDFQDLPDHMYKGTLSVEKRTDQQYEVEFRNVGFCYPGSQSWALRHVSFKFHVGEKLAVVGENGSGKTTFIKLLCRFYDPTEGEILLNGIRIDKYDYAEYMNLFSVVFQDFKLFALPLGENVASGTAVDGARAVKCLEQAGFTERLQSLSQGLDTYLYKEIDTEQGVDMSGGEAQKIALARALYKEAPFIILDEPTAALDPVAEYEIYTKFNEIVGKHTAIYISHRLSSCRFCDQIAVFDKGSVVECGSHDELVAEKDGKYHELWTAQAQYYAENGIEIEA